MYLVCWCLQACECCQDCSGQAQTIAGRGRMGEIPIHFAGRATHPTVWDFGDLQASDLCTCLTHSTGPIICTCVPSSGPAFLPAGGSFQGVHRSHLHDHHGTPAIRAKKGSCDFLQSENCPNSNFKLLSPEKSVAT